MNRIKTLTLLLAFMALFGCHLCQNNTNVKLPDSGNSTTTTTTTTTTTIKPKPETTTTPVPPTPTPAPAPQPKFISGNITESNHTCLRFEFNVHFTIKYNDTKNVPTEVTIPMPLNSTFTPANGACNSSKEEFSLNSTLNGKPIVFNLSFGSNENSVFLDSIHLQIDYNDKTFPDINPDWNGTKVYNLTLLNSFNVERTHSYFCANVTIPKNGDAELKVSFENVKLQAFMDKAQNGEFSSEHNCQNEINDVVPIAVGAALTGLVVIVMIAYFIGRRRSRRLAYQSV